MTTRRGLIFIISAPSGVGKSTLARSIVTKNRRFAHPVSYTTREARPQEKNGKDYRFVTIGQFERLWQEGCFLERAVVHGAHYATSKQEVEKLLSRNKYALLTIDVQGARSVHGAYPEESVRVFLLPPSKKIWRQRLKTRGEKNLAQRMANAQAEINELPRFDYCLINDQFEATVKDFFTIVRAEELRRLKNNVKRLAIA
ncbi:MAG: guanylate kinase [Elusimicrobia bacterium]|nr:guanylate kinase [Elusimicrobiota bacterium]